MSYVQRRRQRGPVEFNCILSGLDPNHSRRVIVNFGHDQSGNRVLRVSCASSSRTLLLDLGVHLLRYRYVGRKAQSCKIAFNALDEDVEWWVLQFKSNHDLAKFMKDLEPEAKIIISV